MHDADIMRCNLAVSAFLSSVVFLSAVGFPARAALGQPSAVPAPRAPVVPVPVVAPAEGSEADFSQELAALFAVGACADVPVPANVAEGSAAIIKRHCDKLHLTQQNYRTKWLAKAEPFMRAHVPANLPRIVVYPFAGGDLSTALTVYPDADEITTLSLEPAGDPRTILTLKKQGLKAGLQDIAYELGFLYNVNFSNTMNMIAAMRGGKLPTQLVFGLSALWMHGFEPVALRYFTVQPDGTLQYLSKSDVALAGDPTKMSAAKRNAVFANVEVQFRKKGSTRVQVYRHIQANLDDAHIAKSPGVFKHLDNKPKIAAMTKAASYLLAWDSFTKVRGFLLGHAVWMISDATGVAPKWGKAAGFEYETWGVFEDTHLEGGHGVAKSWRDEFTAQPTRKLDFRFGYYDKKLRNHMIIMRTATAK
jgi:hypothetical protein